MLVIVVLNENPPKSLSFLGQTDERVFFSALNTPIWTYLPYLDGGYLKVGGFVSKMQTLHGPKSGSEFQHVSVFTWISLNIEYPKTAGFTIIFSTKMTILRYPPFKDKPNM